MMICILGITVVLYKLKVVDSIPGLAFVLARGSGLPFTPKTV